MKPPPHEHLRKDASSPSRAPCTSSAAPRTAHDADSATPRRIRVAAAALASAALGLPGSAGCTEFEREDRIEDMRVLAVRTEPAEILYSPLFLTPPAQRPPFPLPTVEVDVEVFAFDPRGGRTALSRQLCPSDGGDATCRLYDLEADLAREPEAARAELAALLTPVVEEGVIEDDALPLGRVEPSRFSMRLTPAAIDFFIPDDSDGNPVPSVFPLLPRVVVEARNLDATARNEAAGLDGITGEVEAERAFKRIPVSLDLTSPDLPPDVAADFARVLGFELCSAPIPPEEHDLQGRAECLARRVPNANPPLRGFFLEADPAELSPGTLLETDVPPDLGLGSLVRVDRGATLAVTPVFGPDPAERYQVVSFDIAASQVILLNRVEDLACQWSSTRGSVSAADTALQFGDGLGISWQLPFDVETGERDSLILVVLDQRGGTAVARIDVEYR